jgi:hypothetical protein
VVDPDRAAELVRQRGLDHHVRDGARDQRVTTTVDRELAQPRPPLAVAIGLGQRRPQLVGYEAEVPGPVETER